MVTMSSKKQNIVLHRGQLGWLIGRCENTVDAIRSCFMVKSTSMIPFIVKPVHKDEGQFTLTAQILKQGVDSINPSISVFALQPPYLSGDAFQKPDVPCPSYYVEWCLTFNEEQFKAFLIEFADDDDKTRQAGLKLLLHILNGLWCQGRFVYDQSVIQYFMNVDLTWAEYILIEKRIHLLTGTTFTRKIQKFPLQIDYENVPFIYRHLVFEVPPDDPLIERIPDAYGPLNVNQEYDLPHHISKLKDNKYLKTTHGKKLSQLPLTPLRWKKNSSLLGDPYEPGFQPNYFQTRGGSEFIEDELPANKRKRCCNCGA